MKTTIYCPDCGKMLEVTVLDKEPQKIKLVKKNSIETNWLDVKKAVIENAAGVFEVGDKISCTLKNGQVIEFTVAAINPYGKNEVAFVTEDLLDDEYQMNEENTNKGGWSKSDLRTTLNTKIFDLLPDELQAVIKPRTIVQDIYDAVFKSTDKLWIPSRKELFGVDNDVDKGDVHFPLFNTYKSRVKNRKGQYEWYWTRSPLASSSTYFCFVYSGGNSNSNNANHSYGVAFGFLL